MKQAIRSASKVHLRLIEAKAPEGPAIHSSRRDLSAPVIEAALCMTRKPKLFFTHEPEEEELRCQPVGRNEDLLAYANQ